MANNVSSGHKKLWYDPHSLIPVASLTNCYRSLTTISHVNEKTLSHNIYYCDPSALTVMYFATFFLWERYINFYS
jgi:hypothetical protein